MLFWEIKPDFLLKIAVRVGEITENLEGNRKFGLEEMVCFRLAISRFSQVLFGSL